MPLSGYELVTATPEIADYIRLRHIAGLAPRTEDAARKGLPSTLFAAQIIHDATVVGMGRVVGDGGCFFQIVDMAVVPAHQGQGLGKWIMATLMSWLRDHAPVSAYVSLIADGKARHLYAQYGFKPTAPASIGMFLVL